VTSRKWKHIFTRVVNTYSFHYLTKNPFKTTAKDTLGICVVKTPVILLLHLATLSRPNIKHSDYFVRYIYEATGDIDRH